MDNKMDNQEEIRLRLVRPDTSTRTELPVATSGVSAGFPRRPTTTPTRPST